MMTNEDVEAGCNSSGGVSETTQSRDSFVESQTKRKDDLLKQEIQYKIQEREKWQGKQT